MKRNGAILLLVTITFELVTAQFNGFLDLMEKPRVDVLEMDEPWKVLYFTIGGKPAFTRYEFSTKEFSYLEITDLHCKGDQFGVFDQNSLLGSTTDAQFDCSQNGTVPNETIAGEGWSNGKFFLPKGIHNVTIMTLKSPYGSGSAAIRLTSITPVLE